MKGPGFRAISRFFRELKRRKVYRTAVVYGVVAFAIWQVADIAFPALGLPSWTITLVVALTLLGFPLALVLAWAFDMTPEGVRRTPELEGPSEESNTRLTFAGLIVTGVLTVVGAGAWYFIGFGEGPLKEPRSTDRSIAVLPFENMGGAESDQFSAGVHDALGTAVEFRYGTRVWADAAVGRSSVPEITR